MIPQVLSVTQQHGTGTGPRDHGSEGMDKMKRKTLREKFEDSYTAVPVPANNAKGFRMKYIYYAPWYRWDLPKKGLRRVKFAMLISSVVGLLLTLMSMAQSTAVNRMPAVFAPCAMMLCCYIMEFSGLLRFLAAGDRTTKMTYDEVSMILKTFPLIRATVGCIPLAVCMYLAFTDNFVFHAVLALLYGLTSVSALGIGYYYRCIPVAVEKNNNLDVYEKIEQSINIT